MEFFAQLLPLPCICPCLPGQKDEADAVNAFFQDALDRACQSENPAEEVEEALVSSVNPWITNIELHLEEGIRNRKDIEGNNCQRVGASAIVVCGHCIGTDKLGHFVEEGLLYSDIRDAFADNPAIDGDKVGEALGILLEGLDPMKEGMELNEAEQEVLRETEFEMNFAGKQDTVSGSGSFGNFRDRDNWLPEDAEGGQGGASPMDLAANVAGRDFWAGIKEFGVGVGCDGQEPFDICEYVSEAWDHTKNKRKKCLAKPPDWVL